jgi:hypothetical protein
MTMKMKAQKDDALNVATIHLLAMRIETNATVKYFQNRKNLKKLLAILRDAANQLNEFTIEDEGCVPSDCEPWVCCRGVCEYICEAPPDSSRAAAKTGSRA